MTDHGFIAAAEPLMRCLAENRNPHACVIVNSGKAELFDGAIVHRDERYITDRSPSETATTCHG